MTNVSTNILKSYFVVDKLIPTKSSLKLTSSKCFRIWLITYLLCFIVVFVSRQSTFLKLPTLHLFSATCSIIVPRVSGSIKLVHQCLLIYQSGELLSSWILGFLVNRVRGRVMLFNDTFNNISVISWRSVLFVDETRVPWENHWPVASNWQILSYNVVASTPRLERDSNSQHMFLVNTLKSC
jgi:hypothetical protein